jgi:succinate dehydrogenase / fumarate reductase flavoprotein subunit
MMQTLVGIVRREQEMQQALEGLGGLRSRAARVSVPGNREYNPGWHTALDLQNLLTVAEAVTRSAIERKESRGGHFRDDYPDKNGEYGSFNILVRRAEDGSMLVERKPIPEMRDDLKQIVEENK